MKKILDQKGTRLLFLICWVAYFCSYLGRLNYSSVMAVLIDNQLTKAQAGWINTAFLATYAAGQLINGILTEKFPPAAMVFTGVIGGGLTNIAFAFADGFSSMFFLRMLTGYFVSMIWPPMLCASRRTGCWPIRRRIRPRAGKRAAAICSAGQTGSLPAGFTKTAGTYVYPGPHTSAAGWK